ncbi:MAG TPA: hypothetical protein VNZ52_02325 [Candidatus Thermoplasmatota archaeon]|nr:hypothetical protein [Candidatus Thermoplasmatota archaeon]
MSLASEARGRRALLLLLAVALAFAAPGVSAGNHTVEEERLDDPQAPTNMTLAYVQLAVAGVLLLVVLRIAYILASNPIGEFLQELFYLHLDRMRWPAVFMMLVFLVETAQLLLPFLAARGILQDPYTVDLVLDIFQGGLLIATALGLLLLLRHYTTRGLERRISGTMGAIASLQGSRRRRRLE